MADFFFTATPKVVGADGNPWIDPAATLPNPYGGAAFSIPSRQNAVFGIPHRFDKFKVNVQINVLLNPNGTVGVVADGTLGGNLFLAWFAEVPTGMFAWNSVAGISAQQFFTPTFLGAYCAVFTRPLGGGIIWHFEVVP